MRHESVRHNIYDALFNIIANKYPEDIINFALRENAKLESQYRE